MGEGKIEILSHPQEAFLRVGSGAVFNFPLHAHTYYELTLYEPFSGAVTVNGTELRPTAPMAVLMTPADLHRITVTVPTESIFRKVEFDAQSCGGFLLPDRAVCLSLGADTLPFVLFDALQGVPDSRTVYRQSLLHTLLCRVCEEGTPLQSAAQTKRHALIAKALQYLHAHFTEELSLSKLAQAQSVSAPYLSACFSREVGHSYESYLCGLRLQRAAQLLLESDATVTEICYACGYRNLSHFLRSFAKKYGVSPKQYRSIYTEGTLAKGEIK